MLTITPFPTGFNVRGIDANPHAAPRTSGVHLSGIIRKMAFQYGWLKPEYATDNLSELINSTPLDQTGESGNLTRLALGMAIEHWLIPHVRRWAPDIEHQPGEFVRDDVRVTPDALSFLSPDGSPIIHEFKLTYKSARRKVEEEIMWHCQILGYAGALAPIFGYCKEAYLHVLYVNGDYSHGVLWGPRYRCYRLTMDEPTVEQTWQEILKHKEGVEGEEGDGVEVE